MINFFDNRWTSNPIAQSFTVLNSRDKVRIIFITCIQIFLGILDLLGVIAIGALGALSIQGIETKHAGNKVSAFLGVLHLQSYSFQTQVAFLGILASVTLIAKTIFAILFTRKIFYFLSAKSADISGNLISKYLSQDLIQVQARSTQEILYICSDGVKDLMIGILATSISVVTDFSMLLMLSVGLFFIDPVIASATLVIFLVAGFSLYRLLGVRSAKIGKLLSEFTIESNQKILEVLNSYREAVVRNRRKFYSNEITQLRFRLGKVNAEWNFQPYISKYVIESTAILGSLFLGAFEFGTKSAVHAIAVLSVFLAASSRIAPAALRIQQGLLTIKHSSGSAETTLNLLNELKPIQILDEVDQDPLFIYDDFEPDISISKAWFRYPSSKVYALENINLEIPFGTSVAIVGPSGAGKTTLADVILGVLDPQEGTVKTSELTPVEASKRWPGGISYVPQNVVVISGTIKQNVGLGYDSRVVTDERVWAALKLAHLENEIKKFPNVLNEMTGESGNKISGGQRQRLGIARALFSNPKLLILDEATSSLDGQTEAGITKAIKELHGKATVIIVAHRLSTVRSVSKIVYMSAGKIVAIGTFDEVRKLVPDFDIQASLMGL